jgi:hypothetical protein
MRACDDDKVGDPIVKRGTIVPTPREFATATGVVTGVSIEVMPDSVTGPTATADEMGFAFAVTK